MTDSEYRANEKERLREMLSEPVIVIHLMDSDGFMVCSGDQMPDEPDEEYKHVPRYFCRACAHD